MHQCRRYNLLKKKNPEKWEQPTKNYFQVEDT